jgi:hypothetical protein
MEDNKIEAVETDPTWKKWLSKASSGYNFVKRKFDNEAREYVQAYRHEFTHLGSFGDAKRLDVNLIYQTVKTLLPVLYFKNPKVYIKSLQEKVVKEVTELGTDEAGNEIVMPVVDPQTGEAMKQEYDGMRSAGIVQAAINANILKAGVKRELKAALEDSLLMFYGAVKCGWGNDQGMEYMGEGAPPSISESITDDLAYAIRLNPWDVVVDPCNFYKPQWIAVRYVVPPEQLKKDTRLQNTDEIKGVSKPTEYLSEMAAADPGIKDAKLVEYYEIFIHPSAEYPEGRYLMVSEECKNGPLFDGPWPVPSKTFPIQILYFNRDPEGGLPVPEMRYIMGQQRAKVNLRNIEHEFVKRSLPISVVNGASLSDVAKVTAAMESGRFPRVIISKMDARNTFGRHEPPQLPSGFHLLDNKIDMDVSRTLGLTAPVTPSTNSDQLATELKLSASGEAIRQQERADNVSDFLTRIFTHWVDLYKAFAGPENYTLVDGEQMPVRWSGDEIQGQFDLEIKPFSMSYEDPVVMRSQYINLFNLLASPQVQGALQSQGHEADLVQILKRILETFGDKDIESFIFNKEVKPEMQVLDALKENESMMAGMFQDVAVLPTDNHAIHIMLHGLIGEEVSGQHILQHTEAMQGAPMKPGGGNPEGMPINGVAVSQELMQAPDVPNPTNKMNAISREAQA